MSGLRSSSVLALPPKHYGQPKGALWAGTQSLSRFPPTYGNHEEVFEEYLTNKSLSPSYHKKALHESSGLLELHYDTMRKRQKERSTAASFIHGPTMDRMYGATSGYGGFIPGKESTNIVGCTWQHGSRVAREVRGRTYKPAMSGVTYSFANPSRSESSPNLGFSATSGDFNASGGFGGSASSVELHGRSPQRQSPPRIQMQKLEPEY